MDIGTRSNPENCSWKLVDSNKNILASRINYEDSYTYYYYEEYMLVTSNKHVTLLVYHSDSFYDNKSYIVTWDGRHYCYEKYVPVTSNECATLRLFHLSFYGGTSYIVTWNGNAIQSGN